MLRIIIIFINYLKKRLSDVVFYKHLVPIGVTVNSLKYETAQKTVRKLRKRYLQIKSNNGEQNRKAPNPMVQMRPVRSHSENYRFNEALVSVGFT